MSAFAVLLAALCLHADAQQVTMTDVSRAREQLARAKGLTDAEKAEISGVYEQAAKFLQQEIRWKAQLVGHQRVKSVMGNELGTVRAAVAIPLPEAPAAVPTETAEQVEEELTRVRNDRISRIKLRDELSKLQASLTLRADAITSRRGEIREDLQSIADEISVLAVASTSPQWQQASRVMLQARRQSLEQEFQTLETERESLDLRRQLIPLQREASLLKLEADEQYLNELNVRKTNARMRDAKKAMEGTVSQAQSLAEGFPQLSAIATKIASRATALWGPDGIEAKSDSAAVQTQEMRASIARFQEITTNTLRRFHNSGVFSPADEWWPPRVDKFGKAADVRVLVLSYSATEAVARREVFRLEEEYNSAPAFEIELQQILAGSGKKPDDADYAEFKSHGRSLLKLGRSVSSELLTTERLYVNRLSEGHRAADQLLLTIRELQSFVFQHALWTRSVTGPLLPSAQAVGSAFVWWFSWRNWSHILRGFLAAGALNLLWFAGALAIAGLYRGRDRLRRKSVELRPVPGCRHPVRFLSFSILMAVISVTPIPLAFYYLGWVIGQAGAQADLGRAISGGVTHAAPLLFLSLLVRSMLSEDGAADRLMQWPRPLRERIDAGVRMLVYVLTPLWFVASALATEGMQYDSDPLLQSHHNSLGRLCFMAAVLGLIVIGRRVLKPGRAVADALGSGFDARGIRRGRAVRWLFYLIFLFAFLLAVTGFYLTAILLMLNVFRTAAWTMCLMLLAYLIRQWRRDHSEAVILSRSTQDEEQTRHADVQVRRLTRFGLTLVWIGGTLVIWSATLPALSLLKRVELLPEFKITMDRALQPNAELAAAETQRVEKEEGPPAKPSAAPVTAPPETPAKVSPRDPLLLSDVLLAILIGILTSMLVGNLPGLLHFTLFRRLKLDVGAQYAVDTIARYIVLIVAMLLLSRILGLDWSKVQWLAAALTFGIGFGLQEIFANFAAGLIILLDRSIRVGDAVTVGDLSGIVARIRMRATTVTLWDHSDMVVPNKEFIITKLVNWTLSNPDTRVDLNVGVDYGSDVEQVREVLMRVAQEHPAVLKSPAPQVLLTEFGDSAIKFQLQVFGMYSYGRPVLLNELNTAVVREFRKVGIVMAFPQLDIHIKETSSAAQA
jgi:potassium efflux system protein